MRLSSAIQNDSIFVITVVVFSWITIVQYFPRRSETALKKRFRIIDLIRKSDKRDNHASKNIMETATRLLNLYPTSKVGLGKSKDTLKKCSRPISTHFRQADTNESNSSNEKELGNGTDFRESQNNEIPFAKINNQM